MRVKKFLSQLFYRKKNITSLSEDDLLFQYKIENILLRKINDIKPYKAAFSLKSNQRKLAKSHERLEFLGDAILGSIISAYLYESYQGEDEGYLTQMKSKIVSRENLDELGDILKLKTLIPSDNKIGNLSYHISGNLFEAFIGAIYLDFGYQICQKIVLNQLFTSERINKLEDKIVSYKGLILEWGQKNKYQISFITKGENHVTENNYFRCDILCQQKNIANASDSSKKKAEEKAAQRAFYTLNQKYKILEKK